MITALIAVGISILIIAAFCAWAYVRLEPVHPDPRELSDEQVAEIICGTGTEAPRRGV